MSLSGKQKKKIKVRVREGESLGKLAMQMGSSEQEIEKYLKKLWGEKKLRRVLQKSGGGDEKTWDWRGRVEKFSFRKWLSQRDRHLVILLAVAVLLYLPFIGSDFVSDDVFGIVDNQALGDFGRVFESVFSFIRPFMYWLAYSLFGKEPAVFRLYNILSHLAMVGGVFLLVDLLLGEVVAVVAGFMTAAHPIMIESVTWISAGAHSQYALFCVVAVILYLLSYREKKYFWWSVVSFVVALVFSVKAAPLPIMLVVFEWMWGERKILKMWPFFVPSVVWGVVSLSGLGARSSDLALNFSSDQGVRASFLNQAIIALSSYIELIFWPDGLTLYHSELAFPVWEFLLRVVVVIGLLIGMVLAVWKGMKRRNGWVGWVGFWLIWFVVGLGVTLVPTGVSWVVAERYVYLSSVGIYVVVGLLVERLWRKKKNRMWLMIVGGVLGLALMIRTLVRNSNWRNQDNLWLASERTSPSSSQNNNNLGDLYARRGEYEKAIWHFQRATELNPGYASAHHNMANVFAMMGEYEQAELNFRKALEFRPNLWQSHKQLAGVYYELGEVERAMEEIQLAYEMFPDPELLKVLGILEGELGQ